MKNLKISTWNDPITDSFILRISDEEHYVEMPIYYETLLNMDQQALRVFKRTCFRKLVDEWFSRYGEQIYAIEPTQEGTAWTATNIPPDIDGEVVSEEIEPPQWSDPNYHLARQAVTNDPRKAIGGW